MIERDAAGDLALLVCLDGDADSMREFSDLVAAAGMQSLYSIVGTLRLVDAKFYIGKGKVAELHEAVELYKPQVVVFNHFLTPSQERNLERELHCRVLDRTGLILQIFSRRARSFEGRLQVELAQLKYFSTRLVRGWTHLERQRGGIGLRGGAGETQLESDQRMLAQRIRRVDEKLVQVRKRRRQNMHARRKANLPTVALVGYTNAGKSTLFNCLTSAEVGVANQLFSTLDTTLRRLDLPYGSSAIISDTVGFIRDLPHELIAAFHSTLAEVCDADLLLHVTDASSIHMNDQIESVNQVLHDIGADTVPHILVMNKIDQTPMSAGVAVPDAEAPRVHISAATGEGVADLIEQIGVGLRAGAVSAQLHLPPSMARLRYNLYELKAVVNELPHDDGSSTLEIRMARDRLQQLIRWYPEIEPQLGEFHITETQD